MGGKGCDGREKEKISGHKRTFYTVLIYIVSLLIITFFFFIIIGNQNSILVMQTKIYKELSDQKSGNDSINNTEDCQKDVPTSITAGNKTDIYKLTIKERDLVQKTVAAEARGESLQCQMAVAQTIRDRAVQWKMPVSEVILSPGQYAYPYQGEISDSVKIAVTYVFDEGIQVFNEPVTHFYSGKDPYWAEGKVKRGSIGTHIFCY